MRTSTATLMTLVLLSAGSTRAEDEVVEVPLGQTVQGIESVFRRCFVELREAGHDPGRMSVSEIGSCMRPEIEAMAEFAYEISTAYPVSSLTRLAVETCTLEQGNELAAKPKEGAEHRGEKLSWRWLTDCLKEVRWLDHDEQTDRLERARREARKLGARDRSSE